MFPLHRVQNFRYVAGLRPDVQDGRADGEDVVNLARMDETDECIAHHDYVNICRRERRGELIQRLIRKAEEVGKLSNVRCSMFNVRCSICPFDVGS